MAASTDITQHYQLITTYGTDYVQHPGALGSGTYGIRRWRDTYELGRGGFGVVKAQTEITSQDVRAVKTIMKREIPAGLDWKREILAMATLAKVLF